MSDSSTLQQQAIDAVLTQVIAMAPSSSQEQLNKLAEAYAWVVSPGNAH